MTNLHRYIHTSLHPSIQTQTALQMNTQWSFQHSWQPTIKWGPQFLIPGSTILNSSSLKLWDTFHNLNIYYTNVCAVFSQQLLWLKMRNWCQMKALFSSFNTISHRFLNDLYFPKYIHRNYMASRRGWTGSHSAKPVCSDCWCCDQKFTQVFLELKEN